ncbi:MAG: hypothetical protein OMM_09898, partial [Candidatus Magnetoglobus multicellularis str. Araruama]
FISVTASAIEWTYYDLNDQVLQNPTDEEIETNAVMRLSDTGVTQYSLEIDHDFSGTWGTGYLENIGNPSPGVGKHWMNINEEVTCKVDGIVQDVYNMNSRYVATGYMAQGPPNSNDKASALIFDGRDDYASTQNQSILNPTSIYIYVTAKRDRTNTTEYLVSHKNGIYVGFNSSNKAIMGLSSSSEVCVANTATDTGWHQWRFILVYFNKPYYYTTGRGYYMLIYMDNVQVGYKRVEPACNRYQYSYLANETEEGCYIPGNTKAGGNNEWLNRDFNTCKNAWKNKGYTIEDTCYEGSWWNTNCKIPLQICSSHRRGYCDECYLPDSTWRSSSYCKSYWWAKGARVREHYPYSFDWKTNHWFYNHFSATDMMRKRTKQVTRYYYRYFSEYLRYYVAAPVQIGRGDTSYYFQGKIKDVSMFINGRYFGRWRLNDGNESTIAKDSYYYQRNATLNNFDTKSCWLIDPKLEKKYDYDSLQDRQNVPVFKMNSPGKIIYDWGRQHAVVVNSLPEELNKNISVEVIGDESQENHTGAGKFWYNHGTKVYVSADEDDCQKLSGYKDNVVDPTKLISSNTKQIVELTAGENISWVYSPYIFEETVAIGSPVVLSSVPPSLIQKMDLSVKPKYISTDANETDRCYWNDTDKKIFPLQAETVFDLQYDLLNAACDDVKVIVRVTTKWPGSPHIIHVAKTPQVDLDPDEQDDVTFMDIKHVENDATVGDKKFSASEKGRSVLHFKRNYIKNTLPKEISLSFNGYGYVETEEPIGLADNFTIEFYARRDVTGDHNTVISQGRTSWNYGLSINFTSNNSFTFSNYGPTVSTTESTTDQEWHHWACVYETDISGMTDADDSSIHSEIFTCDNSQSNYRCQWGNRKCYNKEFVGDYDHQKNWNHQAKVKRQCGMNIKYIKKIYCDGELVATQTDSYPYIGQGKIRIGMQAWNSSTGYIGQLDEVRIWGTAKTQQQIKASMNVRLSGNESHLLAYFPINRIGSSFLEDGRVNRFPTIIATLKNMDPSNAWKVDTDKLYELEPTQIAALGHSTVRVVQTRLASENQIKANSIVGVEIQEPTIHDPRVPHNGYVFYENVPLNTNIYNREVLKGPIYPVNTKSPAPDGRDNILVIWYLMQDNISWPYQPTMYESQWPEGSNRIVIASRMGSEGKDSSGMVQTFLDANDQPQNYFDPARYQEIEIYNQPNPLAPGYNPNEEHAIITASYRHSSAAPRPLAAFALRNDLNITTDNSDFTSKPLVLVQYYDTVLAKHAMTSFNVETEDISCGYTFNYLIKAGDPVTAPYPLNEVIGATPPEEIYGTNGNPEQICYWKDHKGQSWAISGGGKPVEIASASVKNYTTHSADYVLHLQSETMIYDDQYLIKVYDNRGFMGMMYFTVGSADNVQSNSLVYVDGNSISVLGADSFTVNLRQGIDNLSANHFELFHFKDSAYITVNYWYPLQPSFWLDSDTPGDSTGNVGVSIPWLPNGKITENDNFPADMTGRPKAITVKYDAIWPNDVPILKAGET